MGVRREGLYSLPAGKVLALALAVASQASPVGATDPGSDVLPHAPASAIPPPVPDCHAPGLDAEKLYQAALTIGETSPPEITRDDFERITGVRFGSPKDTLLGSHKTHELAYECAGTELQVAFAEYRGSPESGDAGDARGDGKYKGAYIQEAWKVDPISCIHRERVLDDQRRRGWISRLLKKCPTGGR
jgi:hypothetical protein